MNIFLFACGLILAAHHVHGQGSECSLPGGKTGVCILMDQCIELVNMLNEYRRTTGGAQQSMRNQLTERLCGQEAGKWKGCCSVCTTTDGKKGTIKTRRDCPSARNLSGGRSRTNLRASAEVCCGLDEQPSQQQRQPQQQEESCNVPPYNDKANCNAKISYPPSPTTGCCGRDSSSSSRIVGGTTTAIDEFPWAVLLEYEYFGKIELMCGGSLISNRYVLTAAHCMPEKSNYRLVNVRVGEFDTEREGHDWVYLANGQKDCTPGAISIPIEKKIRHPNYSTTTRHNDIGLIKLKNPVQFTYFVRPICLPTTEPADDADLWVTGWGRVNETVNSSRYKQGVSMQPFNTMDCRDLYANRYPVSAKQICAGGQAGKDSCSGDSGGPLMQLVQTDGTPNYELVGVVSYGPRECGSKRKPGVYTRVSEYLNWIWANID